MLESVQNGLDRMPNKYLLSIAIVVLLLFSSYVFAKPETVDFIKYKINIINNNTVEIEISNNNDETHQVDLMIKNENGFSAEMKPGDKVYQKLKLPFNVTKKDFVVLVDGGRFIATGSSIANKPPTFSIQNIALVMLLVSTIFVAIVLISFYKFFRRMTNEYHIYR